MPNARPCEASPCLPASSSGGLPYPPAVSGTLRDLQTEIARLRELVAKGEEEVEQAWLERDFYFQKLRRIEVMCSTAQQQETLAVKDVLAVLYATDELSDEEGFERASAKEQDGETTYHRGAKRTGEMLPAGSECTTDVHAVDDKDCFLGRNTATEQTGDAPEPMMQ